MESYQFIKQIGQGNYGDVWLVKCSKTRKKFVLKRFDLHRASKREQRAAYLEAKLLSTLKHPNIVNYLDSFYNSKGNLFIVMGYCECGDFYSFIKNRNGVHFEEKEVINWFVQICMALKYLHDKGILHRDLKTQNIYLTKNKLVKVGDLGIARVLKATEEMATTFIGTPYYMSPEIFSGKPYNQKSDVWSLGCCIYEIATLERAFFAQDMHDLMQKILKGKVSKLPNMFSEEFFIIISSMLNPDPDKRPSVTELLLNDFIRKFIILFLKESPIKLNSSKCSSSRSTPSLIDRCKPVSKLSAFEDNNCESKACHKATESVATTDAVKTVPDSNGNGDGNDNSQNHAINVQYRISPVLLKTNRTSKNNCSNDKNSEASTLSKKHMFADNRQNSFKENLSVGEASCSTPPDSSRSTPNINAQKLRSEISFNLLNNLSYTIKQSRLQNWQGYGQLPNLSRMKYFYGSSPPKSAEELYLRSAKSDDVPKRCTLSAQHSFEVESHGKIEISNLLPQIGTNKIKKLVSTSDQDKVSLPLIENSEINHAITATWECVTKDDHFDKLLIQNIMECNGTQQGGFAKSTMCHHRKEILKLNETSNSASIV